jgi:cytochrome c oxidase accessory protein FixG
MTIIKPIQNGAPAPGGSAPDLRLVARRDRVYPMSVDGLVRRFKWVVLCLCLTLYYLLPWLRWNRGPGRADQALLLDMTRERLYIFDWEFWPQDAYFLALSLILAAFGLFLVTSLVGRIWCGYACPQTVWTDLFMLVERHVEGDRNERMRRDAQGLSWGKAWRKVVKHAVWLFVAFWTGGAWIMYFADAPSVTRAFWTGTAPIEVYFFTGLFTLTTYLLAGWAREQVCTFMCPWPRFQAAMLDEQTFTVTYQDQRGEPRGKKSHDQSWDGRGDCIDCRACVNVCPTGIDIRDGQQLECINCGLCIDACNSVMRRIDRPRWLINWDNLARQGARRRGEARPPLRLIRARTMIYIGLMLAGLSIMGMALASRSQIGISVQRDRAPLFVRLADGSIRNGYALTMINKRPDSQFFELKLIGLDGAALTVPEQGVPTGTTLSLPAAADAVTDLRLLVHVDRIPAAPSTPIEFVLTNPRTGEEAHYRTVFLGPGNSER